MSPLNHNQPLQPLQQQQPLLHHHNHHNVPPSSSPSSGPPLPLPTTSISQDTYPPSTPSQLPPPASSALPLHNPSTPAPLLPPTPQILHHQQQQQQQLPQQQQQQPASPDSTSIPLHSTPSTNPPNAQTSSAAAAASASYRPLNVKDALSYLDQVKIQFHDQPDIYNRFLDIMKDFKSQSIDTPGVIERVSTLFRGHPQLVSGFNTFLPPGYRIEHANNPHDPNAIRVTTPSGTTIGSPGMPRINEDLHHLGDRHLQSLGGPPASSQPMSQSSSHPQLYPYGPPFPMPPHMGGHPMQQQSAGPMGSHPPPVGSQYAPMLPSPMSGLMHGPPPQGRPSRGGGPMGMRGDDRMMGGATGPTGMGPGGRGGMGGTGPGGMAGGPSVTGFPADMDDPRNRPPVEFNHAIDYVNKIKNRFSNEPDIYKQFLEILQTYQKEQKPIQEVYAQVTILFKNALDLLDEFKQFLPDTSGQSNGGMGILGLGLGGAGLAGLGMLPLPLPSHSQHQHPPQQHGSSHSGPGGRPPTMLPMLSTLANGMAGVAPRMPPVGNFPPPTPNGGPAADAYGRRGMMGSMDGVAISSGGKKKRPTTVDKGGPSSGKKKLKHHHNKSDLSNLSPQNFNSIPHAPSPVLASSNLANTHGTISSSKSTASQEEVLFFDRVKKYIGNKATYNEFLKVLNLFSQEILDQRLLVERIESFIGGNHSLFEWFKNFVGYDQSREVIDNQPAPSPYYFHHRPNAAEGANAVGPRLNTQDLITKCKRYGVSYRMLPEADQHPRCSGRDALCEEVLNDTFVSHPTWASEDQVFNTHRKNQYEEALHKCEEDRYEYDLNIEAIQHTIAVLEPLAQTISAMPMEERARLRLPVGLGGTSKTIYQRIIKKVYDKERGQEVIDALHNNPGMAVNVVLKRLKQKDEEWRRAQREWNKIWREIDAKNHYKALDHQGINFKANDKKAISCKSLVSEIETLRKERLERGLIGISSGPTGIRRNSTYYRLQNHHGAPSNVLARYQFEFQFPDSSVYRDITRLLNSYLDHASTGISSTDREAMTILYRDFVCEFFFLSVIDPEILELPKKRMSRKSKAAQIRRRKRRRKERKAKQLRDLVRGAGGDEDMENLNANDTAEEDLEGNGRMNRSESLNSDSDDMDTEDEGDTASENGFGSDVEIEMDVDHDDEEEEGEEEEEGLLADTELDDGGSMVSADEEGNLSNEESNSDDGLVKDRTQHRNRADLRKGVLARNAAAAQVVVGSPAKSNSHPSNGTADENTNDTPVKDEPMDEEPRLLPSATEMPSGQTELKTSPVKNVRPVLATPFLDAETGTGTEENLMDVSNAGETSPTWIQVTNPAEGAPVPRNSNEEGGKTIVSAPAGNTGTAMRSCLSKRQMSLLFANSPLYCFFRLYELLYSRLESMKRLSENLPENTRARARENETANDLGVSQQVDDEIDMPKGEHYYIQMLELADKLFEGEVDQNAFEDALRYSFGTKAFTLFTLDKVVQALVKQAQQVISDPKCVDLLKMHTRRMVFGKDSVRERIVYRNEAEQVVGEDNLYAVEYVRNGKALTVQLLDKDDLTCSSPDSQEDRWSYYCDSYILIPPTEGLDQRLLQRSFLNRNKPKDAEETFPDIKYEDDLCIKICKNTYKIFFEINTGDSIYRRGQRLSPEKSKRILIRRNEKFLSWLEKARRGRHVDSDTTLASEEEEAEKESRTAEELLLGSNQADFRTEVTQTVEEDGMKYRVFRTVVGQDVVGMDVDDV